MSSSPQVLFKESLKFKSKTQLAILSNHEDKHTLKCQRQPEDMPQKPFSSYIANARYHASIFDQK